MVVYAGAFQGFFRRALQDIGDPGRKKCYYNKNCDITVLTRNRCQYCRLKKCLALGMSRSGTRRSHGNYIFLRPPTRIGERGSMQSGCDVCDSVGDNCYESPFPVMVYSAVSRCGNPEIISRQL